MILIYDCETTGLPLFNKPSDDPAQPHIIQLAALLVDDDYNILQEFMYYVKPVGWVLEPHITKLTAITPDVLEANGMPIDVVINEFIPMMEATNLLVGHNEGFDRRMVRIEFKRGAKVEGSNLAADAELPERWKAIPGYDTCLEGQKAMGYSKRPTLAELYRYYEGKDPDHVHSALTDCHTTLRVFRALKQKSPKFDKYAALRVAV